VKPVGVLLAGGLARRMGGGDKALRTLGGKPLLDHVIARLGPQVSALVINANGDPARFAAYGLPVIPDSVGDFAGPLAGVLAGLDWAAANAPDVTDVITAPTDGPFLPRDLAERLTAARDAGGADLACAESAGQAHPVVGLWPVRLREDLRRAMIDDDIRKVDRWTARHRLEAVAFSTDPVDPFFNANAPDDLVAAEALLASLAAHEIAHG
jgi:molybdenum cofactor guanylyltransferase